MTFLTPIYCLNLDKSVICSNEDYDTNVSNTESMPVVIMNPTRYTVGDEEEDDTRVPNYAINSDDDRRESLLVAEDIEIKEDVVMRSIGIGYCEEQFRRMSVSTRRRFRK